jgi:hypothetical protein
MVDLRELLAAAINSPNDYDHADAILAALDAAGLVVVPREPTEEMEEAWLENDHQQTASGDYAVMLAASPYAKKEVE